MKKFAVAALLLGMLAVPALAAVPHVSHPKAVHAQNPYLKHPNHKAKKPHRHHI